MQMSGGYKHLSYYQRVKIETLLKEGYSQSYIALQIGVSQSAVSREIRRNTQGKELYLANRARDRADERCFWQRSKAALKGYEVRALIRVGLAKKWTPQTIVGRSESQEGKKLVTVQAIYHWLHQLPKEQRLELTAHLPYFNKRRRKQTYQYRKFLSPEAQRRIDYRSEEANTRAVMGHWETDNVGGKKGDKQTVSISADRASRYVIGGVLTTLKAASKTKHLRTRLKSKPVKTITSDNGSENAGYEELEGTLNTKCYFTHPYRSWEKGTVENIIGWIRRYIPKGTSLDTVSRQKLAWVVKKYNTTPKKCLNWLTPEEVFLDNLSPQIMHFQL